MAMILNCSIDLSKIDKSKINNHKNGSKYYEFSVFINDEKDKYGNEASLKDSQTKEQREAKEKAAFIGNGKKVWEGVSKKQTTEIPAAQAAQGGSDLPF
jgi:hypothetical protein